MKLNKLIPIIIVIAVFFGLAFTVFGASDINDLYKKTSVNRWDVAFESDYYQGYVTSKELSTIPVKIDFEQKIHTLYFYVDNKNPTGFSTYQQISTEENKSKVTLHLAGKDNSNSWIISPDEYDPRIPYSVNYNNNRRVVVKFQIPDDASKNDVYEIGLRAKSIDGENRQILLNLVSEYPNTKDEGLGVNLVKVLMIFGIVVLVVIAFMAGKHFLKKGGKF